MLRIIRALFDGFLLRCPRCHHGRMFASFFSMRQRCPNCSLVFERAAGEITGGMGISIVAVLFLTIPTAVWIGVSNVPIGPALAIAGVCIVVFTVLFYPLSRALWAVLLYLTGNGEERD